MGFWSNPLGPAYFAIAAVKSLVVGTGNVVDGIRKDADAMNEASGYGDEGDDNTDLPDDNTIGEMLRKYRVAIVIGVGIVVLFVIMGYRRRG